MTTAKMRRAIQAAKDIIDEHRVHGDCIEAKNLAEMFLQLTTAVSIMKSAYDAQLKKGRKK